MNISHALSLNDTYWVKAADSDLKWKDISLYDNAFNEIIVQLALEGGNSKIDSLSTYPEKRVKGGGTIEMHKQ